MSSCRLNLQPFLFSSPANIMQNAASSLVPKINLLAWSSSWEISLKIRRGFPQEGTDGDSHSPYPLPISASLESSEVLQIPTHQSPALPPSCPTPFLPRAFQCHSSLSMKAKALFPSWYKDLQFQLVFCCCQQVCWAASFSKKKFAGLLHSIFSCGENSQSGWRATQGAGFRNSFQPWTSNSDLKKHQLLNLAGCSSPACWAIYA